MKKWWRDQEFLSRHKIESLADLRNRSITFRRQYYDSGVCKNEHISIDEETLEDGRFGMAELIKEFDYIRKADPYYIHDGPTNRDLKDPRLARIWEEFRVMKALIGSGV